MWANAMIILDAIGLGPLQSYKSKVELLHSRYDERKVWSLLYQADTRARLEDMPRTKLLLFQQHQAAVAPYIDVRPWNHTLHTVAADDE